MTKVTGGPKRSNKRPLNIGGVYFTAGTPSKHRGRLFLRRKCVIKRGKMTKLAAYMHVVNVDLLSNIMQYCTDDNNNIVTKALVVYKESMIKALNLDEQSPIFRLLKWNKRRWYNAAREGSEARRT